MKLWEYSSIAKFGVISDEDFIETMCKLGEQGWELTSVTSESEQYCPTAYFRRELKAKTK